VDKCCQTMLLNQIFKGVSYSDAKDYGAHLIRGILNQFVDLGSQGIEIRKIWGKGCKIHCIISTIKNY
jgi:hypothetical protein